MSNVTRELVEAGAGCGKTYSLVSRYIRALGYNENGERIKGELALSPDQILCLTFTELAASEMLTKVVERLNAYGLEELTAAVLRDSRISTFHGLCYRLIKPKLLSLGYENEDVLPPSVARELRKQHILSKLHEEKSLQILENLSLSALVDILLDHWFSDGDLDPNHCRQVLDELKLSYENYLSSTLQELRSVIATEGFDLDKNADSWPGQAMEQLNTTSPDLRSLNFRKSGKPSLSKKHPQLLHKLQSLREFQKKGLHKISNNSSSELEIKCQAEILRLLKSLQKEAPKVLDFDAMEAELGTLLDANELELVKPELIIVDEFQDTNPTQFQIIKRLSSSQTQWYFVGDPKQSIYSFRKADIRIYEKLRSKLSNQRLSTNYRSHERLLEVMNYLQAELFAEESPYDPPPQALNAADTGQDEKDPLASSLRVHEIEEKNEIFSAFLRSYQKRISEKRKRSHAVLFQNWKELYSFAQRLDSEGIPYQIDGSEAYLDHHLSDLFSRFLLCQEGTEKESDLWALQRWDGLEDLRSDPLLNPWKLPEGDFSLLALLEDFDLRISCSRWQGGSQWLASMERKILEWEKFHVPLKKNLREIAFQLLKRSRYDDTTLDSGKVITLDNNDSLRLLTIHASKGLQYDCVYLPQLFEKRSSRSVDFLDEDESHARLSFYEAEEQSTHQSLLFMRSRHLWDLRQSAEKKRLFYVAFTRAVESIDAFCSPPKKRKDKPEPLEVFSLSPRIDVFWNECLYSLKSRALKQVEFIEEKTASDESEPRSQNPAEEWLLPSKKKEASSPTNHFRGALSAYIEELFQENEKEETGVPDFARTNALSASEKGDLLHEALSLWNGKLDSIESIPVARKHDFVSNALRELHSLEELKGLWEDLENKPDIVMREFPMVICSEDYTLSGVADVLWFQSSMSLTVIDWKSAGKMSSLKNPKRLEKINKQLELYAKAFERQYESVTTLAVGIELSTTPRAELLSKKILHR